MLCGAGVKWWWGGIDDDVTIFHPSERGAVFSFRRGYLVSYCLC